MSDNPCPLCFRPTADGLLCSRDTTYLRRDLESLARMWTDLDVALTRQAKLGGTNGPRTDVSPLVFNAQASKVGDYVRCQLQSWVRDLDMGDTGMLTDDPREWALWLANRTERIRGHEAAGEIAGEMAYCARLVRQVVDMPDDRVYCGRCEACGSDLYAKPGAVSVMCRKCERTNPDLLSVDVTSRRDAMLTAALDMLATVDELLGAIPDMYGVEIGRKTMRSWIDRGRLAAHGDGRYRMGDALELARDAATRRQYLTKA